MTDDKHGDAQRPELTHSPALEHGADGYFRPASLRTIIARAALAVIEKPDGVETLDWQIADAVIAMLPKSPALDPATVEAILANFDGQRANIARTLTTRNSTNSSRKYGLRFRTKKPTIWTICAAPSPLPPPAWPPTLPRSHFGPEAAHFGRKQDAEKMIAYYGWTRARAVEQMWPNSASLHTRTSE